MQPHPLDIVSLAAGLLFLLVGVGHLVGIELAAMLRSGLWPVLLIIGGVVLLARVTRRAPDE